MKAVKDLRAKFTPQYVQMKNESGIHVPLSQRAETVARYLKNKHWKNDVPVDMGPPSEEHSVRHNYADESLFQHPMGLRKWLNDDNRKRLLSLINTW